MRKSTESGGHRGPFRLALLLLAAGAAPALADWSSDPAHNLVIADGASEQVQAKVVARADGGCYVSWFDNANGGYDVRLQRLSATGEELWPHNGILVADRGYSSTVDYGLAVDGDGNALDAFNDDSQPTERIVVAKLAPDGTPLWGTPGLAVSDSSAFLASPKVAATVDGDVVVAWFQDPDTVLQPGRLLKYPRQPGQPRRPLSTHRHLPTLLSPPGHPQLRLCHPPGPVRPSLQ